jgi:hypothetical protein
MFPRLHWDMSIQQGLGIKRCVIGSKSAAARDLLPLKHDFCRVPAFIIRCRPLASGDKFENDFARMLRPLHKRIEKALARNDVRLPSSLS